MYYVLKTGLVKYEKNQLLCWNGLNRCKPQYLTPSVLALFVLRKVSNTLSCWVFARAQCLYLCQNLYFLLKKINNKWVCMWVLHAIVLICTGVPKTFVASSPILKRQAALQLWPGTTSLIQRECKTLFKPIYEESFFDLWGRGGKGRDPASFPQQ